MSNHGNTQRRADKCAKTLEELAKLRFNPKGVRTLGEVLDRAVPPTSRYQSQFEKADFAFFIANAHKDLNHAAGYDNIHPAFLEAREDSGTSDEGRRVRTYFRDTLMELGFDAFTVLDRLDVGCTVVIRVSGPQPPSPRNAGTLPLPQDLRLHVYAPPSILNDIPSAKGALARMVQLFAEDIAVHTVQRFERLAMQRLNWSFAWNDESLLPSFSRRYTQPSSTGPAPLLPDPQPNTAHYIFRGRPRGEVEQVLDIDTATDHAAVEKELREQVELIQRQAEECEVLMHTLDVSIAEKDITIGQLEADLADANRKIEEQRATINTQSEELQALRINVNTLRAANNRVKGTKADQTEAIRQLEGQSVAATAGRQTMSQPSSSRGSRPAASLSRASSVLSAPATPPRGATAASAVRSAYVWGFGAAVQRVIEKYKLEYTLHTKCTEIANRNAGMVWETKLLELGLPQNIASELSDAMLEDVNDAAE